MALPTSGSISAAMINVEMGKSSTANFSIDAVGPRLLAEKETGSIAYDDFRGKAWHTHWIPVLQDGSTYGFDTETDDLNPSPVEIYPTTIGAGYQFMAFFLNNSGNFCHMILIHPGWEDDDLSAKMIKISREGNEFNSHPGTAGMYCVSTGGDTSVFSAVNCPDWLYEEFLDAAFGGYRTGINIEMVTATNTVYWPLTETPYCSISDYDATCYAYLKIFTDGTWSCDGNGDGDSSGGTWKVAGVASEIEVRVVVSSSVNITINDLWGWTPITATKTIQVKPPTGSENQGAQAYAKFTLEFRDAETLEILSVTEDCEIRATNDEEPSD